MSSAGFEQAKAFLQKSKDGSSLYDHLADLIVRILDERPDDAFEVFEVLSRDVKKSAVRDPSAYIHLKASDLEAADESKKDVTLFEKPPVKLDEDGEPIEEEDEEETGSVPDLVLENHYLNLAGAGLNEEEIFRLMLSVKKLVKEQKGISGLRFFGKFFTLAGAYYVVETKFEEEEADEGEEKEEDEEEEEEGGKKPEPKLVNPVVPVPKEGKGEGVNRFTYWVASHVGETWTRLADATPEVIKAARNFKHLLTGDLEADVYSRNPVFPGTESDFLRAQIARIAHATDIAPKDFYAVPEDEEDEDEEGPTPDKLAENEEYEVPPTAELATLENWVHHAPVLLQQGRVNKFGADAEEEEEEPEEEEEDEDEVDEEEKERKEIAKKALEWRQTLEEWEADADPWEQPGEDDEEQGEAPAFLSAIDGDKELLAGTPAWTVRALTKTEPYDLVVLRNSRWPGAHTVCWGKRFASVYVGWGTKFDGTLAGSPLPPPPLMEDPDTLDEEADPTLEKEKEIEEKRKDLEAAKKEAEEDDEEEDED